MLTDKTKTYQAVMLLGVSTDTQDTTGTVLSERSTEGVDEAAAAEAAESFIGLYHQIPPMYSALKVNGKKLYELAREGKEVERQARPVEIFSLSIDKMELPRVTMTVHCSKEPTSELSAMISERSWGAAPAWSICSGLRWIGFW